MDEIVDRARTAIGERAELPGMSLLEHLEELRKRLIRSAIYLVVGFCIAYAFRMQIYAFMQKPITTALEAAPLADETGLHQSCRHLQPYIMISLMAGAIIASPFILYQVWLFISPGLYQKEKRYVIPFMSATIGLFLAGAFFAYEFVYPGALDFLIGYSSNFTPMVTVEEYTKLFLDRDPWPGNHL